MKKLMLLFVVSFTLGLFGCGSNQPLPDTSSESKPLPPGTKTKDVLMPIDK